MKSLLSSIAAARGARSGVAVHGLIWITAKTRPVPPALPVEQSIGFWTGDDHTVITIAGRGRTYFGAGNALDLGDGSAEIGIAVRSRSVTLSGLSGEVEQATKGYDARLARVEIHRAEFDPLTGNLIDAPERVFKGWIDKIAWSQSGGEATCALTLASISRALTRPLPQKYSDASQRLRRMSGDADDRFFQYTDVGGNADVWWGEKRVKA